MEEIRVMEKPDWVSWDDIHELLLAAHKKNIAKGMVMRFPQMTGSEVKKKVGDNGLCLVALDGHKVVGTTSVCLYEGKAWFGKNKTVAHCMLTGILPQYQGIGIQEEMNIIRNVYVTQKKADLLHADTAENNIIVRKKAKMSGFVEVAYMSCKGHYSVVFVKWLKDNPFPLWYCRMRFFLSKWYVKSRFKESGQKRF